MACLILASSITGLATFARETFKQPDTLHLVNFYGAKKDGDKLAVDLPAKSVVTLELN